MNPEQLKHLYENVHQFAMEYHVDCKELLELILLQKLTEEEQLIKWLNNNLNNPPKTLNVMLVKTTPHFIELTHSMKTYKQFVKHIDIESAKCYDGYIDLTLGLGIV